MWPQYFIFSVYLIGFIVCFLKLLVNFWKNEIAGVITHIIEIIAIVIISYALYKGHFFTTWGWN